MNSNNKNIRKMGLFLLIFGSAFFAPKAVNKIQSEKRAYGFYKYMTNEVDKRAQLYVNEENRMAFVRGYEKDSLLIEQYLANLSRYSKEYNKDMRESSYLINDFDKTVSFDQALKTLNDEGYNVGPNIVQYACIKAKLINAKQAKER